jgi:hypothetical protein
MHSETDPPENALPTPGECDNGGSFPDIPTNDKGKAIVNPLGDNFDSPEINTNDLGLKSIDEQRFYFPDIDDIDTIDRGVESSSPDE